MHGSLDDDKLVSGFFDRSLVALQAAANDPGFLRSITDIAHAVEASLRAGGKLMLAGNGGSAADAQHLAAEFLSRFLAERQPLPAVALTTDSSVLTAVGNDYGYEYLFERQVRGLDGRATCCSGFPPRAVRRTFCARSRPRKRSAW